MSSILSLQDAVLALDSNAGRIEILHGISLDVQAGETLALVGPSGSGKSSLLMLMGGLERATSGTITALDHDLSAMSEDALARFRRENMGVVFQNFHLIPTMTALENVATPLELAGRKDAMERAQAELEAVGLAHRADHYPSQMSGGEQQRVALARACAPSPRLLLADEPTGNLDPALSEEIMDLFKDFARVGVAVLIATHDLSLIARYNHRLLTLREGRLIHDGDESGEAHGA